MDKPVCVFLIQHNLNINLFFFRVKTTKSLKELVIVIDFSRGLTIAVYLQR